MEYLIGLRTGLGLILVIGAQNAFVLRQGIRREFIVAVVLACAVSDALLISAGVAGMGSLTERLPWAMPALRWGGVAFLIVYGARSFWAAWQGGEVLQPAEAKTRSFAKVIATCLALTWLNPHVYVDTVLLIGSLSTQFPGREWYFGAGAVSASFLFFTVLGFGARALAPVFAKPVAWRVLDMIVGGLVWSVAAQLAFGGM